MKALDRIFLETWRHVRTSLRGHDLTQRYAGEEFPLRSELFSADQMEQHGKTLAGLHTVESGGRPGPTAGTAGGQ